MGDNRVESLTDAERRVMRLVARNRGSKDIAVILGISSNTVENQIKSARAKVGGRDRFYVANALAEFEGRSQSLASQKKAIENLEQDAADEGAPAVEAATQTLNSVREERATADDLNGQARLEARLDPSRGQDDLRTLTIISLVMAIALLIAVTFSYAKPLSGYFQQWANNLHQIQ